MMCVQIHGQSFELLIGRDLIKEQIVKLGAQLQGDYHDKNPIFIVLLSGSFIFAADLIREFQCPCEVSFIKLSSYHGTISTGKVSTVLDLSLEISGRDIIIIEDIIDTGTTMNYYLTQLFETSNKTGPASVRVVTLLFKPMALKHDIKPDYIGFNVPNDFLVGYGLDYDQQGRNLQDIYRLKDEE